MSLIIKGMEMPQAGDMIICGQIEGKLQCTIVTRNKPTKWCEASEIPTPHGRLIDADRLIEYINKELKGDEYTQRMFRRIVKSRPTIIEAEVNK